MFFQPSKLKVKVAVDTYPDQNTFLNIWRSNLTDFHYTINSCFFDQNNFRRHPDLKLTLFYFAKFSTDCTTHLPSYINKISWPNFRHFGILGGWDFCHQYFYWFHSTISYVFQPSFFVFTIKVVWKHKFNKLGTPWPSRHFWT